jgi:hypothetical protein
MKRIRDFFKSNKELLDDPEVLLLIDYCQDLEGQLQDIAMKKQYDKELVLMEFINDVYKSCKDVKKQDEESVRWGETPRVDYEETVRNLQEYISEFCRINNVHLDI